MNNHMTITFPALAVNEGLARVTVAAFAVQLSPTLPEMADIKTAVSEAVTNAIVHGYAGGEGEVEMRLRYDARRTLTVEIIDTGCGIADIEKAMEPFYTTGAEGERSGMGFCVMQTFMDGVSVDSAPGRGTTVTLVKRLGEPIRRPVPQAGAAV